MAGAASVLILFISALSSWGFARGLLSRLGLPAGIFSFRSAADSWSGIGFIYPLAFVAFLLLGFLVTVPKEVKSSTRRAIACGFLILGVGYFGVHNLGQDVLSPRYSLALSYVAVGSPASVGLVYRSLDRWRTARAVGAQVPPEFDVALFALSVNVVRVIFNSFEKACEFVMPRVHEVRHRLACEMCCAGIDTLSARKARPVLGNPHHQTKRSP
jgi:hypothetical protein